MINTVNSRSRILYVSQSSGSLPYVSGEYPTGALRFNSSNQNIEVYDGSSNIWKKITGPDVSIEMDHEFEETLHWARDRMRQENEWKKLSGDNEALKIALEEYEKARSNLNLLTLLAKEHNEKPR
jgi:hypothetical protein